MAQIIPKAKKDGSMSYLVRVYAGRTQDDKVIARRDGQEESREVGAGAGGSV